MYNIRNIGLIAILDNETKLLFECINHIEDYNINDNDYSEQIDLINDFNYNFEFRLSKK